MLQSTIEKSIEPSWFEALKEEFASPYMEDLAAFVRAERASGAKVYPPAADVFASLNLSPLDKTRVVIVGQDPYHGEGQAHGLSFSVRRGVAIPPSLKNIYKELKDDLGINPPDDGCLEGWAEQGVLLLNAALTVREKAPGSHAGRGWERFTDAVCTAVAQRSEPTVFILWGKFAQNKVARLELNAEHNLILQSPHPSPFSAYNGFFGSKPFSKANQFLESKGCSPIQWQLK